MSKAITQRFGVLCAAIVVLGVFAAAPAWGALSDPLFVLKPEKPKDPKDPKLPPPAGYLEGPCGLGVDPNGFFYVSDYYHHAIDIFKSTQEYVSQFTNVDPLNGPCGLALDGTGVLYVNNFHSNVTNLTANSILPLPPVDPAHHLPTGVAVEPVSNRVYVDNRTYITAFEPDGTQVMDGLEPLRIGLGNLGDGYGVAVTGTGRLYVPDASTKTVKIYEPTVDKVNPVGTLKGPGAGFVSLRDASVAVDQATGVVYVTDNQQPAYAEEPEAGVYMFSPAKTFLGVLKYKVFAALPPGLAVDNSGTSTQSRVYVTSGNTDQAAVYAYGPGAQTSAFLPPTAGATVHFDGGGRGTVRAVSPNLNCTSSCTAQPLAGSEITFTATPDEGSTFDGWSGGCSGTDPTCRLTMDEAASVTASFEAAPPSPGEALPPLTSLTASPATQARPHHRGRRHRKARHHHKVRKHRHHRVEHRG